MKEFDRWNAVKKRIEGSQRAPIKTGEVYWCRVGLNVGVELDGKDAEFQRPVLILKKFSNEVALCAPLTSKEHDGDWYYRLPAFGSTSHAILNQIRPFDTKRFMSSMGQLSKGEVNDVIAAYFALLIK